MNKSRMLLTAAAPMLFSASLAFAQNIAADAPAGPGATTIYRQVMPDGRVVYSDTATKGVKIDRVLSIPRRENQTAAKSVAGERSHGSGASGHTTGSAATGR